MKTPEILYGLSKYIQPYLESSDVAEFANTKKPKIRKVDRVIGHREEYLIHNRRITEQTIYESKYLVKASEAKDPKPQVNTTEIP